MNRFIKSIPITPDMVSLWVPGGPDTAWDMIRSNHGQCYGTHPNVPVLPNLINPAVGWHFDKIDDYVDCGNAQSLRITNNLSIFVWTNGSAPNSNASLLSRYDFGVAKRCWLLSTTPTSKLTVQLSDDGSWDSGHRKHYTTSVIVSDDKWHFIGITFSSGTLKLYVDSVEDTSPSVTHDAAVTSLFNTDIKLLIGGHLNRGNLNAPATGYITLSFLANTAWSQQQIENFYLQTKGMFAPRG